MYQRPGPVPEGVSPELPLGLSFSSSLTPATPLTNRLPGPKWRHAWEYGQYCEGPPVHPQLSHLLQSRREALPPTLVSRKRAPSPGPVTVGQIHPGVCQEALGGEPGQS